MVSLLVHFRSWSISCQSGRFRATSWVTTALHQWLVVINCLGILEFGLLENLEGDVPLNVNYLIGVKKIEVNNDNKLYDTSFICGMWKLFMTLNIHTASWLLVRVADLQSYETSEVWLGRACTSRGSDGQWFSRLKMFSFLCSWNGALRDLKQMECGREMFLCVPVFVHYVCIYT